MDEESLSIALDSVLDIRKLRTTGSVLELNFCYDDDAEYFSKSRRRLDEKQDTFIGEPIDSFSSIEPELHTIDSTGFVKKKIIGEGNGAPLHDGCTVTIALSGFWEGATEPFDVNTPYKPLTVDLKDDILLPGLQTAIKTMLVGELSMFLLSYEVMYREWGCPPRIRPKADCIFYIKLLRSILTPNVGPIKFSEPNMFKRVTQEVKLLYSTGCAFFKANNFSMAVQSFKKAVNMLHKCRLANEHEQTVLEKLLKKIYMNLAICYNNMKQPYKACIACNELENIKALWNNGKALYQNAKALTVIGNFTNAEKKFKAAMKLCPDSDDIKNGIKLLNKTRETYDNVKMLTEKLAEVSTSDEINDDFKREVDNLISDLKSNADLRNLTLPPNLSPAEVEYVKSVCERENLFCFQRCKTQNESFISE